MLAEHYRVPMILSETASFDGAFKEQVDEWVKREEVASKENGRAEKELRRDVTADEIEKCITKLQSHKAAGANGIANGFTGFGGKGTLEMIVHSEQIEGRGSCKVVREK